MRAYRLALVSVGLALWMLLACAVPAFAAAPPEESAAAQVTEATDEPECLPVYLDGLLFARALLWEGELFLPPEPLCVYLDMELNWNADDKKLRLVLAGVELTGEASEEYMRADGRYLYTPQGWHVNNGELYLPEDTVTRLFGVRTQRLPDRVEISTAGMALISGGDNYYELNYHNDDIYWLMQVINSESRFEPLAGMIGVGNVVMNRIASKDFPDTVFDVVFDVEHVVQFEPVSTGGIYVEPDPLPRVAAYLVLEGYNTVGDSLYFVNPSKGSYWFDDTLELVLAIGNHNFYR